MVHAHRQAWCWQDEYFGLTIEDIRQLEHQTALALAKKMAVANGEEVEDDHIVEEVRKNENVSFSY